MQFNKINEVFLMSEFIQHLCCRKNYNFVTAGRVE